MPFTMLTHTNYILTMSCLTLITKVLLVCPSEVNKALAGWVIFTLSTAESFTSKDLPGCEDAKKIGMRPIWGMELLYGLQTKDKGMENNKMRWRTKSEEAKGDKDWEQTVGISGFNPEIPADSSCRYCQRLPVSLFLL